MDGMRPRISLKYFNKNKGKRNEREMKEKGERKERIDETSVAKS